jgi:hypothetical protein
MRAVDLDRARKPANAWSSVSDDNEPLDPRGCVFVADCNLARERGILQQCKTSRPPLVTLEERHRVACFGATVAENAGSLPGGDTPAQREV